MPFSDPLNLGGGYTLSAQDRAALTGLPDFNASVAQLTALLGGGPMPVPRPPTGGGRALVSSPVFGETSDFTDVMTGSPGMTGPGPTGPSGSLSGGRSGPTGQLAAMSNDSGIVGTISDAITGLGQIQDASPIGQLSAKLGVPSSIVTSLVASLANAGVPGLGNVIGLGNLAMGAFGPKQAVTPDTMLQLAGIANQIDTFLSGPNQQALDAQNAQQGVPATTLGSVQANIAANTAQGLPTALSDAEAQALMEGGPQATANTFSLGRNGGYVNISPRGPTAGGLNASPYSGSNFGRGRTSDTAVFGARGAGDDPAPPSPVDDPEGGTASTGPSGVGPGTGPGGVTAGNEGEAAAGQTGGVGGGGDGSGDSTVICTWLFERGELPAADLARSAAFGRSIGRAHVGYRRWAEPLVHGLRRSSVLRVTLWPLIAPLVRAYVREITRPGSSRLGRAILTVGIPVCAWLGRKA